LYYMSPVYCQDIINSVLHIWSFNFFFLLIANYLAMKAHYKESSLGSVVRWRCHLHICLPEWIFNFYYFLVRIGCFLLPTKKRKIKGINEKAHRSSSCWHNFFLIISEVILCLRWIDEFGKSCLKRILTYLSTSKSLSSFMGL